MVIKVIGSLSYLPDIDLMTNDLMTKYENSDNQITAGAFAGEQWVSNPRPSEPQSDALTN